MPDQTQVNDNAIIKVKNLEHSYGEFKAVDGISFSVKKGEIFSFLGPNGGAKVTRSDAHHPACKTKKGDAYVARYDVTKEPQKVSGSP